jgi:hypothetical protein
MLPTGVTLGGYISGETASDNYESGQTDEQRHAPHASHAETRPAMATKFYRREKSFTRRRKFGKRFS